MRIALRDQGLNKLTVSSNELERVILLGRRPILQGIEEFYEKQALKNPDLSVTRPSIWTTQFGTTVQTDGKNSKIFTEKGYANGGIITSKEEAGHSFTPIGMR